MHNEHSTNEEIYEHYFGYLKEEPFYIRHNIIKGIIGHDVDEVVEIGGGFTPLCTEKDPHIYTNIDPLGGNVSALKYFTYPKTSNYALVLLGLVKQMVPDIPTIVDLGKHAKWVVLEVSISYKEGVDLFNTLLSAFAEGETVLDIDLDLSRCVKRKTNQTVRRLVIIRMK